MKTIAKERINQIVNKQPEDSSYEEIVRELIFSKIIERGINDSDKQNIISHEKMKTEIMSWS